MLNVIWPIFIIVSFIYAILDGNIQNINDSIIQSTSDAIELSISLLGTICLWNGIMEIASNTSIIEKLIKLLNPLLQLLFPDLKNNEKIKKEISMNMIANILGLGNAATPLGLKAMKSMQMENKNKKRLTDSMLIFIVLNTASLQIIPTTVIAIRSSLGSNDPTKVIFPVWIATISAAIVGVFIAKLSIKLGK